MCTETTSTRLGKDVYFFVKKTREYLAAKRHSAGLWGAFLQRRWWARTFSPGWGEWVQCRPDDRGSIVAFGTLVTC